MGYYFKSPDEKNWYMIKVDGKIIAILEESPKNKKEIERLFNITGVKVEIASPSAHIKYNTKTILPLRIVKKMEDIYRTSRRKKLLNGLLS